MIDLWLGCMYCNSSDEFELARWVSWWVVEPQHWRVKKLGTWSTQADFDPEVWIKWLIVQDFDLSSDLISVLFFPFNDCFNGSYAHKIVALVHFNLSYFSSFSRNTVRKLAGGWNRQSWEKKELISPLTSWWDHFSILASSKWWISPGCQRQDYHFELITILRNILSSSYILNQPFCGLWRGIKVARRTSFEWWFFVSYPIFKLMFIIHIRVGTSMGSPSTINDQFNMDAKEIWVYQCRP